MEGLQDKTVVVTGGASGIGLGIALVFVGFASRVVIADRDGGAAVKAAAGLASRGMCRGVACDVTDRASVDRAIGEVEAEIGPVDVLVNNAGVSSAVPFVELSDGEWARVVAVNLTGVFLASQRVLPPMLERGRGRIVNISSMAGKEGLPQLAHYCATKFGVIGLTQSLALEVASSGVTVNAVCPGVVRTPLWDDPASGILGQMGGERAWNAFVGGIPLGRPQTAEDIGHACAYLASDHGANVTGEALNVSGGQQMH